jgi:hypothetical protein
VKKLTDGRRTPSDGNTLHDPFGPGELKRTKRQTVIYKTLHRKQKTEQHEPRLATVKKIFSSETAWPNLAGSIYVRSSIKVLRFVPFGQQIWLSRTIRVSDWLMLKNQFIWKTLYYLFRCKKRLKISKG